MFCPQCGTQNDARQSYCRQCGQPLATIRLALEGSADEALAKFKKGSDCVVGGLFTFGLFLINVVIAFLVGGVWPAAIALVLGLLILLPFIIIGTLRLQQAERLLAERNKSDGPSLGPSRRRQASLPTAPPTDPLGANLSLPSSVTEHTTFELNPTRPER